MARRDSFDDGHGMDHHRLRNALRVVGGATMSLAAGYGPIGAIAGAAVAHGINKYYDKREEEDEEY
jgi:hypothetical protein